MDAYFFHLLNGIAWQSRAVDAIVIFLAEYLPYATVFAFFVLLFYSKNERFKKNRIFWNAAISTVIARFGVVELIRFFYHRPRPFVAFNTEPFFTENLWSFPSGHAAFFFALATALFFHNKKWGVWLFVAALVISVSRVIVGVHYPSDILGGALVGIATAYFVFWITKKSP